MNLPYSAYEYGILINFKINYIIADLILDQINYRRNN